MEGKRLTRRPKDIFLMSNNIRIQIRYLLNIHLSRTNQEISIHISITTRDENRYVFYFIVAINTSQTRLIKTL